MSKIKITTAAAVRLLLSGGIIAESVHDNGEIRRYSVYARNDQLANKRIAPSQFRELLDAGLIECVYSRKHDNPVPDRNLYKLIRMNFVLADFVEGL